MSRRAIDNHLENVGEPLLKAFGDQPPYAIFSDSLESYGTDWTVQPVETLTMSAFVSRHRNETEQAGSEAFAQPEVKIAAVALRIMDDPAERAEPEGGDGTGECAAMQGQGHGFLRRRNGKALLGAVGASSARERRRLARMVVGRDADAAEAEDDVAPGQRAPERLGQAAAVRFPEFSAQIKILQHGTAFAFR
mgnify:CR=1 FL=1